MYYYIIFTLIVIYILYKYLYKPKNRSGFSLSKKPMEEDNHLLLRNPFDDIDYITPVFYKIK